MRPERLEVSGRTLDIEQGDDGRWSFAGFPTGARELSQAKRDALAKQIAGFGHLVVQNCTLAFSGKAFGENGQEVRIIRLDVEQRETGFEFASRAQRHVQHRDVVARYAEMHGTTVEHRKM